MRLKNYNDRQYKQDVREYDVFTRNKKALHGLLTEELGFSRQRASELLRETNNLYTRIIENYFDINCTDLANTNINKVKYIQTMFDLPFKQLRILVEKVLEVSNVQTQPVEENYKTYYTEAEEKELKEWFELAETLNNMFNRGLIGNATAIANGLKNKIYINPKNNANPFSVKG